MLKVGIVPTHCGLNGVNLCVGNLWRQAFHFKPEELYNVIYIHRCKLQDSMCSMTDRF